MMKRTLVIVTLAMLLLAGLGTTAAAAKPDDRPQMGNSQVYQYDVMFEGHVAGKIVINARNADAPTFVFNGNWPYPGSMCYLRYRVIDVLGTAPIGEGLTNAEGHITIKGTISAEQWYYISELPSQGLPGEFLLQLVPYG